jgi:hypothetical protein
MISKINERRKWMFVDTEEGRNNNRILTNEFKRSTDEAKKKYLGNICNKTMEFERIGH